MSAGLAALLDDVAALVQAAAASVDDVAAGAGQASTKAAGVIIDDAAVTPRYVQGITAERELPMIKRIAKGSLKNKLVFILPVVLLLSEFLPDLMTPLLMVGGFYLCYEGAEKIWERVGPGHHHGEQAGVHAAEQEEELVSGAIRTDFILSAEIMVISLNEVVDEAFLSRALILIVVALAITALVYGAVGLIVKMDDVGLRLAQAREGAKAVARTRPPQRDAEGPVGALGRRDRRDDLGRRAHPAGRPRRARRLLPLRRGPPRRGGRPGSAGRAGRPRGLAGQHRRLGNPRCAGRRRDRRGHEPSPRGARLTALPSPAPIRTWFCSRGGAT